MNEPKKNDYNRFWGADDITVQTNSENVEPIQLTEMKQIVGVYGYKVKHEIDCVWRFSFIVNAD